MEVEGEIDDVGRQAVDVVKQLHVALPVVGSDGKADNVGERDTMMKISDSER